MLKPVRIAQLALGVIVGFTAISVVVGSFYTIPQTDLGFVTQFGKVVDANAGPITPGLHFKIPFIQSVDTLRVTRDTDDIGVVSALTKDTQAIDFKVGVTTTVPPSAVYHLLYEVGKAGNVDLKKNYDTTILTELRNVISRHTIIEIAGGERETVLQEFQIAAQTELRRLYGTNIDQVQVSVETMPKSYVDRINQAMLSQAAILQSERDKTKASIDAETAKITAAGEANRAIEQARGRSESNLLEAQAQSQATKLKGQADADVIALKGKAEADAKTLMAAALTANPTLVEYQKTLAWNGMLPQNIYASAPIPFFSQPAPQASLSIPNNLVAPPNTLIAPYSSNAGYSSGNAISIGPASNVK